METPGSVCDPKGNYEMSLRFNLGKFLQEGIADTAYSFVYATRLSNGAH